LFTTDEKVAKNKEAVHGPRKSTSNVPKYLNFENFTRQKVIDTSPGIFKAEKSGTVTPKKRTILREFCWENHIKI
jgi:hypothetical protein